MSLFVPVEDVIRAINEAVEFYDYTDGVEVAYDVRDMLLENLKVTKDGDAIPGNNSHS
jgi:hypothetical protein